MSIIYFSVPVISGYYIMQYVNSIAEENLKDLKTISEESLGTKQQNDALDGMLKGWKNKSNNSGNINSEILVQQKK